MNNNGFTLLEILFVLGIYSLLILLSIPLLFSSIDKQVERQFLTTLQSDILYLQTQSHGNPSDLSSITFNDTTYTLRILAEQDKVITRPYPQGWHTDGRTFKEISFKNGTIRQAGTILLQSPDKDYRIIFPLGKGRGYIEEQ